MEEESHSGEKRLATGGAEKKSAQHSKSVLFPAKKDYSVCREFVEEFHQSVLQSTRQTQKDLNHLQSKIVLKFGVSNVLLQFCRSQFGSTIVVNFFSKCNVFT